MSIDLKKANSELAGKHPQEIVNWAVAQDGKCIVTTNFGPHEAVILHLAVQAKPDIEVVWIDSGYFTEATYTFAHGLIESMNLNLTVYSPIWTKAYRDVVMGGTPGLESPHFDAFADQVKLEPFNRAMREISPDIWLTAIRKEQTEVRGGLDVVTMDSRSIVKVAPVFHWTAEDLDAYLAEHQLPNETDYFDPTKVLSHRECGLHIPASS